MSRLTAVAPGAYRLQYLDEHPPSRRCDCPECRAYFEEVTALCEYFLVPPPRPMRDTVDDFRPRAFTLAEAALWLSALTGLLWLLCAVAGHDGHWSGLLWGVL